MALPQPAYDTFDLKTVRNEVSLLAPRERKVLELIYFQGFKYTEVAEVLQLPLGTVKTSCRAGIARLRGLYLSPEQLAAAC